MKQAQHAIDFDVLVIAIRGEPDQLVSPEQAAEAMGIGTAGGQPIGLVDYQSRDIAVALEQFGEALQHLRVGEPAIARFDDALHLMKQLGLNDRLKRAI